jgi:hypothetical protein
MEKTCTPYRGTLTEWQQARLISFLWPYLRRVPGVDQVQTGEGTKTQTGLLATIEDITKGTS